MITGKVLVPHALGNGIIEIPTNENGNQFTLMIDLTMPQTP